MLPQLYQNFQKWSSKGSVWIYSDPHFGNKDCKIMSVDWPTPQEQIKIINSKVTKNDTLIILGDIGDAEYIKQLKAGYKVLIAGNHDAGLSNYQKTILKRVYDIEEWESLKALRDALKKDFPYAHIVAWESFAFDVPFKRYNVSIDNKLFDEVYGGPLFISDKILLSHEPIDLPFVFNIHGHKHDLPGGQYNKNHYNVCSNCIGYEPVNLGELIKSGFLKRVETIHRLTIDKVSENSIHSRSKTISKEI